MKGLIFVIFPSEAVNTVLAGVCVWGVGGPFSGLGREQSTEEP